MQAFDAYDIKYVDEDDEGEAIEGSEMDDVINQNINDVDVEDDIEIIVD